MVAPIAARAEDRRIDRTSACWCLVLLVAAASCCCCMLLLQHAVATAAAADRSRRCTTAPPTRGSAADVARVCFPKSPILSLFCVSEYAHCTRSSIMTVKHISDGNPREKKNRRRHYYDNTNTPPEVFLLCLYPRRCFLRKAKLLVAWISNPGYSETQQIA